MQGSAPARRRRGRTTRLIIGFGALSLLAATGLFHLARARTFQLFGVLITRVETTQKLVALTFDDGPNADRVDEVLGLLGTARATFFVNGVSLDGAPDAARQLVAAGHEIGNHTYSHARLVLRSQSSIREEIERTDSLIRAAGYRGEILFRPPYGWKLAALPWFLSRTGRVSVTWDVEPDSYPEVRASPQLIAAHVREHVRPGSIVLLHPWWGYENVRTAIPLIIADLSDAGYRLVTVTELLDAPV